jgi:hypothetical protein
MHRLIKFNFCKNGNIYKKLKLQDINCNINKLNKFRLSYNNLPIDIIKNGKPTRLRRYANFNISFKNEFKLEYINSNIFKQNVDDFRNKPRIFQPIEIYDNELKQNVDDFRNKSRIFQPIEIYDNEFLNLIKNVSYLPLIDNKNIKKMNMHIHQVRLISYPFEPSDNSPEGIHRDGADYIISALILNKHNIKNDTSIIYNENMEQIYNTNLNVGEFIFQEDRKLFHDIKKIKAIDDFIGYRDILGFDFTIIE